MAQTANVRSIDAIKEFKIALITFAEEARVALSAAEMELNHTRNWLERDQLAYWKSQVKRCQEQVAKRRPTCSAASFHSRTATQSPTAIRRRRCEAQSASATPRRRWSG